LALPARHLAGRSALCFVTSPSLPRMSAAPSSTY
jgi:hypothetical protein